MAVPLSHQLSSRRGMLVLICTCLFLYWLCQHLPAINSLEWKLQDQFIEQRAKPRQASEDILVIDIDDTSLIALGQVLGKWPWPRSAHAEVLEYLQAQSPQAVIFDMLFTEPDLYRPDSDAYFAEVLSSHPNTYLAIATQATHNTAQAPLLINYDESVGLTATENAQTDARALLLLPQIAKKRPKKKEHNTLWAQLIFSQIRTE